MGADVGWKAGEFEARRRMEAFLNTAKRLRCIDFHQLGGMTGGQFKSLRDDPIGFLMHADADLQAIVWRAVERGGDHG